MSQSLLKYPHIEFTREAVSKRAKETKTILASIALVCEHPDGEHRLYRHEETSEYWQYSSAWNWGGKPYCFLVPEIDAEEWKKERYVDPDEMLLYVAAMQQFLSVPTNRTIPNLKGHIESLQKIGNLPKYPKGRWFGPYERQNLIPNLEQIGADKGAPRRTDL
jgi:hypothetical protein